MIDESKPLPVEANNSTIELHLAVEAKEKLSEYIESKSLSQAAVARNNKYFCMT